MAQAQVNSGIEMDRKFELGVIVCVLIVFLCSSCMSTEKTFLRKNNGMAKVYEDTHKDKYHAVIGVWALPYQSIGPETSEIEKKLLIQANTRMSVFRYDGIYVTLLIFPAEYHFYRSPDYFYKIYSAWIGDDLYVLKPLFGWEYKATFKNGNLYYKKKSVEHKYISIEEGTEISRMCKEVTIKRELHDYSITRHGTHDYDKKLPPLPQKFNAK